MTYYSFKIYENPAAHDISDCSDLVPFRGGPSVPSCPGLWRWANDRSIAIHYIDNAWIRVPVTRDQLIEFLSEKAEHPSAPEVWSADLTSDAYVLEEEEF